MRLIAAALAPILLLAGAAHAAEQPVTLKDAPGRDAVASNCGGCHSLDYVVTNSVFLDRKQWEAEVAKMINAFGAPIEAGDAKAIADYLARAYGK